MEYNADQEDEFNENFIEKGLGQKYKIELIGARTNARQDLAGDNIAILPAVDYTQVPELLATSRVLLLLLSDNLFGRSLTSPLKLWDYLASTAPIVAPHLASIVEIQEIAQADFHFYRPDDLTSLRQAVDAAQQAGARKSFLRSWETRALEMVRFLRELG